MKKSKREHYRFANKVLKRIQLDYGAGFVKSQLELSKDSVSTIWLCYNSVLNTWSWNPVKPKDKNIFSWGLVLTVPTSHPVYLSVTNQISQILDFLQNKELIYV